MHGLLSTNFLTHLITEKSVGTILALFIMLLMWKFIKWVIEQQKILMKQAQEREDKLFDLFSGLKKDIEEIKEANKTTSMRQRMEHETMLRLLNTRSN